MAATKDGLRDFAIVFFSFFRLEKEVAAFFKNVYKYELRQNLRETNYIYSLVCLSTLFMSILAGKFKLFFIVFFFATFTFFTYWYRKIEFAKKIDSQIIYTQRPFWLALNDFQLKHGVASVFRTCGFGADVIKVENNPIVNIILKKEGSKTIVHCKQYTDPVELEVVRSLWAQKNEFNANKVVIVAPAGISDAARDFVQNHEGYSILTLDDIILLAYDIEDKSQDEDEF